MNKSGISGEVSIQESAPSVVPISTLGSGEWFACCNESGNMNSYVQGYTLERNFHCYKVVMIDITSNRPIRVQELELDSKVRALTLNKMKFDFVLKHS